MENNEIKERILCIIDKNLDKINKDIYGIYELNIDDINIKIFNNYFLGYKEVKKRTWYGKNIFLTQSINSPLVKASNNLITVHFSLTEEEFKSIENKMLDCTKSEFISKLEVLCSKEKY